MSAAAEHMSLADVKNRLSEVVERLERKHGRVVITKHGRPAAVVLSVEDLEGLEETLELLSDARAMRRVRRSQAELAAGEAVELTKGQALALARRQLSESSLSIRWTPTAQRHLRRLPEKIATAVVEFIYGSLADNPERVGPSSNWSSPVVVRRVGATIASSTRSTARRAWS